MKVPFVDLKLQYQSIKPEIDKAIENVLADMAFIRGQYVEEFEANFAKALDAKYCIGVGNGTDAITIALKAVGVGDGDEVITAANSFIATSEAITNAGARVVFVDGHPDYYNIDVDKIEGKITAKTKAIIPVHLYGQPADMGPIMDIARKYELFVVEDSAQAHLAEYASTKVGGIGHVTTFSFYPGKNLGAYGDAGSCVTNDEGLAKKIKMLANHGRISKYDHEFEGANSRMDGMQGAILNVKLSYLQEWTNNRRKAAALYDELLTDVPELITPQVLPDVNHSYHLYVIRTKKRDALMKLLEEAEIGVGIHYPIALPNLSAYKYLRHKPEDFPVASKYQDEILSLPMFPELSEREINYVAKKIKEFFEN